MNKDWKARAEKAEAELLQVKRVAKSVITDAQTEQQMAEAELERVIDEKNNWAAAATHKQEKLERQCAALVEALDLLYGDTAEYIAINHLGDVHHNRSMRLARDALAHAKSIGLIK